MKLEVLYKLYCLESIDRVKQKVQVKFKSDTPVVTGKTNQTIA